MLHRRSDHLSALLLGCAVLVCATAEAQSPRYSAAVPPIDAGGLHATTLSAELLGASRPDLGDIRLLDSTGAQVPYVIKEVRSDAAFGGFLPYTLLRNEALPHSTVVEVERTGAEPVDALHIWIRPLDAQKKVRVTGSDDRKRWYMVKDEHLVAQGARGDPPHQVLIVDLPRSDYRYFRLTLNDSLTAPMQVLGVGRFADGVAARPRYIDAGGLSIAQRDSTGQSVLSVRSPRPLLIERLEYQVNDTVRYRRNVVLRRLAHETVRKGRNQVSTLSLDEMGRSVIASDLAPLIELPSARLDTFDLIVRNGDDRPLHITALHAQVVHRVLLAELEPGMSYRLTTGDAAQGPPHYDMAHFADELTAPLDTLTHGALGDLPGPVVEGPAFDPSKWWVWAAIIALMLGMGWVAVRLLKGQR